MRKTTGHRHDERIRQLRQPPAASRLAARHKVLFTVMGQTEMTSLAAAIPAVIAYNHFAGQIRVLSAEMDNFASEFLNIAERHFLK